MSLISLLPTSIWTDFSWGLSNWLATPVLVVLPLLGLIGLPWLMRLPRWKRRLNKPVAIFLVVYLVLVSPPVAALAVGGLVQFLPADSGATVNRIVILNRGEEFRISRVEVAAELWQAKRAPKIFLSGEGDAIPMIGLLKEKGVPSQVLSGENCSRTTEENALFTAAMLYAQDVRKILLVTDPPHMLRSLLTLQSFGFTVIPYLSPLPSEVNSARKTILAVREYLGLASYAVLGRFRQRPFNKNNPPTNVLKKLSVRRCPVE